MAVSSYGGRSAADCQQGSAEIGEITYYHSGTRCLFTHFRNDAFSDIACFTVVFCRRNRTICNGQTADIDRRKNIYEYTDCPNGIWFEQTGCQSDVDAGQFDVQICGNGGISQARF
jgi:hypothetical protein